jgi:hypothetical protein
MKDFTKIVKASNLPSGLVKLAEISEDYAKTCLNETHKLNFGIVKEYDKLEKAVKIQETYYAELERQTGKKIVGESREQLEFLASLDEVQKMSARLLSIIVDSVQPIYINAMGLNMLAEFHYGGYNDTFDYEVTDPSLYKVSKMGDRQKHTKTQRKEKVNKPINTEFYGLTTISTLPEYLLGEAMVADDAIKMALSLNRKIYTLMLNEFVTKANAMTDADLVVAGYTEDTLLEALRLGSAKNGSKMVIVADAIPCKTVLPEVTGLQVMLQDEYNTTLGHMSMFNRYNVLDFDVVEGEDGSALGLPVNRIFGLPMDGSKLIHIAIGASAMRTDEYTDNNDLSAKSTLAKQIGVALATNRKIVRCDLS